jgi:ribonucleoside-diphosphate reductase alpha chain
MARGLANGQGTSRATAAKPEAAKAVHANGTAAVHSTGTAAVHASARTAGHSSGNGAAHAAVLERAGVTMRIDPHASPADRQSQFATFQIDAPACDSCGAITVRNGNCYLCHNCGNSMGCS